MICIEARHLRMGAWPDVAGNKNKGDPMESMQFNGPPHPQRRISLDNLTSDEKIDEMPH